MAPIKQKKSNHTLNPSACRIEQNTCSASKNAQLDLLQNLYQKLLGQDDDTDTFQPDLIQVQDHLLSQLIAQRKWTDITRIFSRLKKVDSGNLAILRVRVHIELALGNFEQAGLSAAKWIGNAGKGELKHAGLMADALILASHQGAVYDDLPTAVTDDLDRILAALEAVGSSSFAFALARIRPVSLRSMFSSWKWFIKGICAYYKHEDSKALSAFDKLPVGSASQRAAEPFRLLIMGTKPVSTADTPTGQSSKKTECLCLLAGREDIAEPLARAEHLWQKKRYQDSFKHLKTYFPGFLTQKSSIGFSLTSFYYGAFRQMPFTIAELYLKYLLSESINTPGENLFERFKATQAMALWLENEVEWDQDIIDVWKDALAYFCRLTNGGHDAETQVYIHLGKLFAEVEPVKSRMGVPDRNRRKKKVFLRNAELAEICYQKAVQANPDSRDAHTALLDLYEKIDDQSKINRTLDAIIRSFPDEKDALFKAGLRCVARKALIKGMKYLEQGFLLDPIDRRLRSSYMQVCLKAALAYAQKGQTEKCVGTLTKAEQRAASHADDFDIGLAYLYARWAAMLHLLERGNSAADQMLAKAFSACRAPLKLHYFVWLIGILYDIPQKAFKKSRITIENVLTAPFDPQAGMTFVHVMIYYLYLSDSDSDRLALEINRINQYLSQSDQPECTDEQARIIVEYALSEKIHNTLIAQIFIDDILGKTPDNARFRWLQFLCNFSMDHHPSHLVDKRRELQEITIIAEHQGIADVVQAAQKVLSYVDGIVKAYEDFNEFYGDWESDKEDDLLMDEAEDTIAFGIEEPSLEPLANGDESEPINPQVQLNLFDFFDFESTNE